MVKGIVEKLKSMRACSSAVEWAKTQSDWQTCWGACERGDWMLWLLGKLSGRAWGEGRKPLVLVACQCARLALPYTKDPRVLKCIETAEAWTRGEATQEELRAAAAAAADAAYDAYAAANAAYAAAYAAYAAYDAAYAAYAAAYAAYDAAYDAAYAAYAAAYAAYDAAYAAYDAAYAAYAAANAAYAAAYAAAKLSEILKQCADIVRKHYPTAPDLERK
jgi:hypothetical protein